jgi:hypothetical protein
MTQSLRPPSTQSLRPPSTQTPQTPLAPSPHIPTPKPIPQSTTPTRLYRILTTISTTVQKILDFLKSVWPFSLYFHPKAPAQKHNTLKPPADNTPSSTIALSETEKPDIDEDGDAFWEIDDDKKTGTPLSSPPTPQQKPEDTGRSPLPTLSVTSIPTPLTSQQKFEKAFIEAFPKISVKLNWGKSATLSFGSFLLTKLFKNFTLSTYDEQTGKFVLSFEKERTVVIRRLPKNLKVKAPIKPHLKKAIGYTLYIGKEVKGVIQPDQTILLEKPSLWIPITWGVLWAYIYSFQADPDNPNSIKLGGQLGLLKGVAPFPAQDFVDILTLNGLT